MKVRLRRFNGRERAACGLAMVLILGLLAVIRKSPIKCDEEVIFFGSCASLSEDGQAWVADVRGAVYGPETDSLKRRALVAVMRKALDLDSDAAESELFKQRARCFLVDAQRRKQVGIRIGSTTHALGLSDRRGQFAMRISIPVAEAERLAVVAGRSRRIEFSAELAHGDARRFAGWIELAPSKGLSVVTDVDDTIKVTSVANRREMLRNSFIKEFEAVDGMAKLYQELARRGAVFHYVSGGPWQMFPPLEAFRTAEGFPRGTFHLKPFSLMNPADLASLSEHRKHKRRAIEPLLNAFPTRRFVLVGDSGEQDPEIFGELARTYPRQIAAVWIRNATGETAAGERLQQAMNGVPAETWQLFDSPDELRIPE